MIRERREFGLEASHSLVDQMSKLPLLLALDEGGVGSESGSVDETLDQKVHPRGCDDVGVFVIEIMARYCYEDQQKIPLTISGHHSSDYHEINSTATCEKYMPRSKIDIHNI